MEKEPSLHGLMQSQTEENHDSDAHTGCPGEKGGFPVLLSMRLVSIDILSVLLTVCKLCSRHAAAL